MHYIAYKYTLKHKIIVTVKLGFYIFNLKIFFMDIVPVVETTGWNLIEFNHPDFTVITVILRILCLT